MRIGIFHNLMSGGAKRVVVEQLRGLAGRHSVTLLNPSSADRVFAEVGDLHARRVYPFEPLPRAGSPFGRLNPLLRLADVQRMGRLSAVVARDAATLGFDVVLVHPCQMTQAPLVLRHLTVPSVYYCHEWPRRVYEPSPPRPARARDRLRQRFDRFDPAIRLERTLLKHLDRVAARAATLITCNSQQTCEDVAAAYNRKASLCHPGVSYDPDSPGVWPRERYVLTVGALAPHKGFDFVIGALSTIRPDRRPPLVIISNYQEPGEREYLSTLAERCSVNVRFECNVAEPELRRRYAAAACLAYAPLREPFGLVVLEAMAAGTPVVAVNEGGIRETVTPDVTGLACPREMNVFGAAVARVLEDDALARRLGDEARRSVLRERTWGQHVSHLEALLEEAANGGNASSPRVAEAR